AYDKYNQEGQDKYNQYGLLSDDYDRQRALHAEGYQRLVDAANAARSDYYSGAESFYDAQDRANKALYDEYDMAIKQIEGDKPKETTLTPSQWNTIFDKADEMAMNGEGSLALYVNTLVNAKTISPDAAADLMNQYFPLK
ncbi:MAG: hypothetical protein U0M60_01610, partial [Clostridia bacterium]|nr:hypothetical protein [Clostridia bacterium]